MPLIIDSDRVPGRWLEHNRSREICDAQHTDCDDAIRIAFINNMPDPALEDTEMQFFELLDAASGDRAVLLSLLSLPGIPRSDRGREHIGAFYSSTSELWNGEFDALIVTGTEPHHADLREEPYWPELAEVFEWAEQNTKSTILSCLAAHASVLHSDGILRHSLPDKRFGVFDSVSVGDHLLTSGSNTPLRFPHSRWNEVAEAELVSCGYSVLTKSKEAGVDLFVKRKKQSLFVHFQGHPEYGALTLFKEYRRDIKRFLRRERETYPSVPYGYFGENASAVLAAFQEAAVSDRREETMSFFPEQTLVNGLKNSWHSCARHLYRNWLQYVVSRSEEKQKLVAVSDGAFGSRPRANNGLA